MSQSDKKHRGGRSPSPARSSHLARSSDASSGAGERDSPPPPLLVILALVVVTLDVTVQVLAVTALLVLVLRIWTWGCGLCLFSFGCGGDDNHSSTVDSLDMDRDDSFRAVLCLIWEFHSLEEPASVVPNR